MSHRLDTPIRRRRATITKHASALGRWELATAPPAKVLLPFAREYVGWDEQVAVGFCRRELPTEEAPLIINFGAPFHLTAPGGSRPHAAVTSFITGAYDTYQLVESTGLSSGVQVNLTLLGIRLLVGRPIEDMTNRALAPEDVFGEFARDLTDRLYNAPTWDARFECLDHALVARMRSPQEVPAAVRCAWHRLVTSPGRVSIGSIVKEIGWSQRHFIAQFKHEIGVSPKVLARILRFSRVIHEIRATSRTDLAGLAVEAGYYDQSHLNRDTREFAGTTPGGLMASLLPDRGGFAV